MITNFVSFDIPLDIIENWQKIINLLSRLVGVPAALIMRLEGPDISVFVSSASEGNPYHPGEKETFENSGLYCEEVIKSGSKLLVSDALADEKWKDNPDVKLNMISYLGFPIFLPNKKPFGTICVLDNKPNAYSEDTGTLLETIRNLIELNLETIFMNRVLEDENKRLCDYLTEIQIFRGLVPICSGCKSIRDKENVWHPIEKYLINHPKADFTHTLCPKCLKDLYPDFYEE